MQIKKILETLKRAYNLLKVSSTEPSPKSDIWLKKGKNLFNKNNIVENYYIKDEDGSISEYDSNMCYGLDYIEVSPNAKYTMSNTSSTIFLIAEYDKDKTFIKQNRQNDSNNFLTITTGETTKYIRISLGQTQIETIQFEAGDKTEYEEYIEPKIYVKNNSENYEEITYEGYGPAGVAVVVNAATDNKNRTAADVRHIFDKFGGNLGTTGCVSYLFSRKGVIIVLKEDNNISEDDLMLMSIEAGAENFENYDEYFEITTTPEDFSKVSEELEKNNIKMEQSEIRLVPSTYITLDEEKSRKMQLLIDHLEDLDDVMEIYHNWDE